ncbi:MAG TPA: RNA polymerase sigma factor [Kofleriaceae bacterium]
MTDAARTIEAIYRIESPKLIARLARITRDVGQAEELAQDALVTALERWPIDGVPDNPAAWLVQTAKHRAIDLIRRRQRFDKIGEQLGHEPREHEIESADRLDDPIGDELLGLVFVACHPVLSNEARVALTLRLVGGLTVDEIAKAFLVPAPTIAQRIVRAKKVLADANVPFEVPRGDELAARLASVLEVVYLIFNEGYAASAGAEWTRPELCEDALRLGRVLAELAPGEPEAHGLVALMEIQASRLTARIAPDGSPILLLDQNRARWDWLLVRRGLAALDRALALAPPGTRGPYVMQAAIAACHGRAREASATDWARIAALYGELAAAAPSPIVELNRAVAVGMAEGPAAALAILDDPALQRALTGYHLLPSVRGDALAKLGRVAEARAELERAAELATNARERDLLVERARRLG